MKKVTKTVSTVLFCLLFAVTVFFVVLKFLGGDPALFGFNVCYIVTGSMEPEISAGDIILCKKTDPEELKTGDVITYKGLEGDVKGKRITHKIIDIKTENGNTEYITKGTANEIADPPVSADQIISKMIVKVPFAGKLFSVVNSKWGFFFIIIVPLAVVVVMETTSLIKTLKNSKGEQQIETHNEKSDQ